MNRRLLSLLCGSVAATLCTACGGGSDDTSNQAATSTPVSGSTVVNGVTVPPAPEKSVNASVLGVDANKNSVRDDAERILAARFGAAPNQPLMQLALAYQEFLATAPADVSGLRTIFSRIQQREFCLPEALKAESAGRWVRFASLNSPARIDAFESRMAAIAGDSAGLPAPVNQCSA